MMKRQGLVPLVMAMVAGGVLFAAEELDVYTYMYEQATSPQERLGILKNVAEARIQGAGQLYSTALSRILLDVPNLRSAAERQATEESVRLIVQMLGDAKYGGAAADLWKTVQSFSNPLVKADALIALGRIRANEYFEQVVRTLQDLNTQVPPDPEAGEKIAYGAILALEKYQRVEGYLPVFFASIGWYTQRVRNQAERSLPLIAENPEAPLSSVIQSPGYSYEVQTLALKKMDESAAPGVSKSRVAALALQQAWKAVTQDVKQRVQLGNMRKMALTMLRRYGTSDTNLLASLERSYKEGIDFEERVGAVEVLAGMGSDDAARLLAAFLMEMNTKRRNNLITAEDERMVRALIPALGKTGKSIVRPALQQVEFVDWTDAVKTLAKEALGNIK